MRAKKSVSTKIVVLLLAIVLLIGCAAGGTLAWLMAKSDTVTNTFSAANINITLIETFNTDSDSDKTNDSWVGKMVPGTSIAKDPKVTVLAGSEACWLFVKVTEAGGVGKVNNNDCKFNNYVTYTVRTSTNEWTALDGESGVYYREVPASDSEQSFYVLTGNDTYENGCVTIPSTVTKAMLDAIGTGDGKITAPSLTFTAYAVQKEGFTDEVDGKTGVERAWEQAQTLNNSGTNNS